MRVRGRSCFDFRLGRDRGGIHYHALLNCGHVVGNVIVCSSVFENGEYDENAEIVAGMFARGIRDGGSGLLFVEASRNTGSGVY